MFFRPLVFIPLVLSLCLCVSSSALAQTPTLSGSLEEVRIEGTSTNLDLIKTVLVSRPGIPVSQIDLEAERNQVLSLGYYSEVTASLEDRGGGPVLVIRVKEYPRIAEVVFAGDLVADPEQLKSLVANAHVLEPGAIFNTDQAEDSIATLQRVYRENGFPFDVTITLDAEPLSQVEDEPDPQTDDEEIEDAESSEETEPSEEEPEASGLTGVPSEDEPLRLTYTIIEDANLDDVVFEGNTVLDNDELSRIFSGLKGLGVFDLRAYIEAVQAVNEQYDELGYRNSGVYTPTTSLEDGVLSVSIRELRVGSYDSTAIGVDPGEFTLQPGDLYNYDTILDDVRRLAEGRTTDIDIVQPPLILSSGDVRISFRTGPPDTAGPIEEIQIEGNTVIPTEELLEVLELKEGDTFSSALATEDFNDLLSYYEDQGYVIEITPDFNYIDRTYIQRIIELVIVGYTVSFEQETHRSEDFIITRYLPDVGTVLNIDTMRQALANVARQGAVQPLNIIPQPTDVPGEVIVDIPVRELRTGNFQPGLQYDTNKGFSAAIVFGDRNFLGRGHTFNSELTAQSSDVGFMVGGNISYSVPWLYIDALDFQEVPTSLSASLFSNVETNNSLTEGGDVKVCRDPAKRADDNNCNDDEKVFVGEYTNRDTGLGFSVGRRVLPDTTLRVSARGTYSQYLLEPEVPCVDEDGDGEFDNALTCTLTNEESVDNLPQSGLSANISSALNFDNRDNPDFPRTGFAASGSVGIGFGNDYRTDEGQQTYSYVPVEFGVKTYLTLSNVLPEQITDPNHVFAFRVNAGHQFGSDYPFNRYFRIGQTIDEGTLIRGYTRGDFNPSQTYVTGSVEYRYDFNLSTAATETIIGIAFLDTGWGSRVDGFDDYATPFFLGAGIGVQVNLGFTALGFFPLRFDYGFSAKHPSGVFSFRIGPVF